MVKPDDVDDAGAQVLAFDVAQKIRNELTYPGQITVTVIRGKMATSWTNQPDGKKGDRRRQYGRSHRSSRRSRSSGSRHAAAG
jgi:hypothetical protein